MLKEWMESVAEEYGFDFATTDDDETHIVECVFEGGRSQVVSGAAIPSARTGTDQRPRPGRTMASKSSRWTAR